MQNYFLYIICLLLPLGLTGQDNGDADPIRTYAESITVNDMKAHLYFLADDLLEGRETGERGQHLASIYIRSHFMRLGLTGGNKNDGSFFQKFYLNRSETKDATISIGKNSYSFGKEFIGTGGMPDELSADLVFAGFGLSGEEYDNLTDVDVKGKVAIILSGTPNSMETKGNRFQQLRALRNRKDLLIEKGAKAVIIGVPDSVYKVVKRYGRRVSSVISPTKERGFPLFYFQDTELETILTKGKTSLPELREKLAESPAIPKTNSKSNISSWPPRLISSQRKPQM